MIVVLLLSIACCGSRQLEGQIATVHLDPFSSSKFSLDERL
jgi:hypothetical protein